MFYDQDSTQVSTTSDSSNVSTVELTSVDEIAAEAAALQDPLESTLSIAVVQVVDSLPSFFRTEVFGFELWQFAALIIWVVIAATFSWLFEALVSRYIRPFLKRFTHGTADAFVDSMAKPIRWWLLFVILSITSTLLQLNPELNDRLTQVLTVFASIATIVLVYRLTEFIAERALEYTAKTESSFDDQLVPLIRNSVQVIVIVVGVLFILQNNGVNVTSLIAGLGLGGLAFALAAQNTLANFFGSITLFLDRPFQVGDVISAGGVEGTVEEVGFRSSRIRTFYNSQVTMSNAKLADLDIDNLGRRQVRRFRTNIGLTYDTPTDKIQSFVEGVRKIVDESPDIWDDSHEVHFNNMGAYSLDILVNIFFDVKTWTEELSSRHRFLMNVMKLGEELGVEFAFPTQTLHVESMPKTP
ncbi:MAG: mechanosensitive ion channel [Balneolaceae bacterium]|nr:mechanosensitive ion channel [Balneolaceae bacterium]